MRDGDRWVSWDADWGAHTSESTEERGARDATYAHLLDPNALTAALRIGPGAPTRAAGRTAWRVTAIPRDEDESATGALFRVGPGAERIELTIDAERGALLRSEACLGGEPFHRLEVTEIEYGALPADSFALELPTGVEPAGDPFVPRWLPLHEVQAEVPFAVFVPARLPESWRLQGCLLVPGRGQPPIEPEVSLMYASGNGAYTVTLRERAATAERDDWLEWTSDGELDVADAGEHVEPRHYARAERAGTLVELSGQRRDPPRPARPCARSGTDGGRRVSRTSEGPLRGPSKAQSIGAGLRAPVPPEAAEALPGALLPALQEHLLDREMIARPGLDVDTRGHERVLRHVDRATALTSPARVGVRPAFFSASTSVHAAAIP